MDNAAFFAEVKRRVSRACLAPDPLVEARRFMQESGSTGEGQMVRKAVQALGGNAGEFGDSDVHRLGADALALVSALADAKMRRRYRDAEWLAAVAVDP
jgi:hypothetical protein